MTRMVWLGLAVVAFGSGGCVTETVSSTLGSSPRREVRYVAPAPASAPINDLAVLKGMRPFDTTGDGFPNQINVSVYLFARPYAVPRFVEGALIFTLTPPREVEPIAEWTFDSAALAASRIRNVIGEGYTVKLDLSKAGVSHVPSGSGDLKVVFVPTDGGNSVESSGVQAVRFEQ